MTLGGNVGIVVAQTEIFQQVWIDCDIMLSSDSCSPKDDFDDLLAFNMTFVVSEMSPQLLLKSKSPELKCQ